MPSIQVQIHARPQKATLVQANAKTVWVRLPDGSLVKRHRVKHIYIGEPGTSSS